MATSRKTPPTPPAAVESPADDSPLDTALGSYEGDDAIVVKLAPEKYLALLSLGLDEPYEQPESEEEASRLVDGWVDWLLTTYPALSDEIDQLRQTESQINTDSKRLAKQLRERKQQAKTLLKLLVRAETRDDLRLRELVEQIVSGVQHVVGMRLPEEFVQVLLSHPDIAAHLERTPDPELSLDPLPVAEVPTEAAAEPAAAEPDAVTPEPVHMEIAADTAPQEEEQAAAPQPVGLPEVSRTAAQLHAAWVATQRQEHNELRSSTGESLFVPYDQLSEKTRAAYVAQVETVYAAIRAVEAAEAASAPTPEIPAEEVAEAPENAPEADDSAAAAE